MKESLPISDRSHPGMPMRPFPSAPIALFATFLATGGAVAQQKPAWVDPPARNAAEPAGPEKADAAKSSDSKPGDGTSETRMSNGEPARPTAGKARNETRNERRIAARRAELRAILSTSPRRPGAEADPRAAEWAGAARRLAVDYLDSISAPNGETLLQAPRFYGERVLFHGRSMSTAALIAEKRRFVRRWPQRHYSPQEGGIRTTCNAASATCLVRTTLGFRAESPARNARSQGVSELVLTVSFAGGRPVIVSESSRVLRRGNAAFDAVPRFERGA